ncbi:MAG: hypothetical protein A3F46_00265 [Legionellales bacterium RIFCSPHIGHO2_12_FULL_42_9]|nr:MAG: hypothetical protein A3F46_00265 [Legionellales bacterium RIFCSPHIGHO2_12_FULL_42_9]
MKQDALNALNEWAQYLGSLLQDNLMPKKEETESVTNTQHTVESIAEILDLDPSELLDLSKDNEKRTNKLKLLSEFLGHYELYC